jgi:hypothetical protein
LTFASLLLGCLVGSASRPSGRVSAVRNRPLIRLRSAQRAVCHFTTAHTYYFHLTFPLTPTSTVNRGSTLCKVAPSMVVAPVSPCRSQDRLRCDFLLLQSHSSVWRY